MAIGFNKITHQWISSESDPTILVNDDWVIDPVFDDREFAMQIGPTYWNFPGDNTISTPTLDAYNILESFDIICKMTNLISAERYRRTSTGGYLVEGYWFNSDDSSRVQQLTLSMIGNGMPDNILWKTMSGAAASMTPALAAQVVQASIISDMLIFGISQSKIQQMKDSKSPGDYNYLAGWPKIYGE